jgi:DnaJ family protein C protein 2
VQVFGPAFRRQSRWSVATPVPELGNDDAPDADVDGFYGFWFAFKSWREFPHPDEEDVEQAEGREHR